VRLRRLIAYQRQARALEAQGQAVDWDVVNNNSSRLRNRPNRLCAITWVTSDSTRSRATTFFHSPRQNSHISRQRSSSPLRTAGHSTPFDTNLYSAPPAYAGKILVLKVYPASVTRSTFLTKPTADNRLHPTHPPVGVARLLVSMATHTKDRPQVV
jgi:hypothetical protein